MCKVAGEIKKKEAPRHFIFKLQKCSSCCQASLQSAKGGGMMMAFKFSSSLFLTLLYVVL
jgi:hypothetical protein